MATRDDIMAHYVACEPAELHAKRLEFIQQIARMIVPGDDTESMRKRVAEGMSVIGKPAWCYTPPPNWAEDTDPDEAVLTEAGDDYLTSETVALWALVRQARELLK